MSSIDTQRAIADLLQEKSDLVSAYLDHAKHYADLIANHAEALVEETWPQQTLPSTRVLATIKLTEAPNVVRQKVAAVASKAKPTYVFVCRPSMTLYILGSE
jgi:hypothetical protein